LDLNGKAAIVTGSSSDGGIGAECAKILASRGCNVVVNYATDRAGAEKVAAGCAKVGVTAVPVQADVAKDPIASGWSRRRSTGSDGSMS
jgi:3-oxoacyl-[acyl-carrier protein] reductase